MKCVECKVDYPEEILAQTHTSEGSTGLLCGICALEFSNQFHGVERTHFTGEIAEGMRLDALAYRKRTNQDPVKVSS